MPRTGLRSTTVDVSFKGGLAEKLSPEFSPPEGAYILENAELDKLGVYSRRAGMKQVGMAALPPGGPGSVGIPKKIAGRGDELFIIAEQQGALGSGGGAGNTGSIVWSHSEEWDAWRAHSKVPSVTAERITSVMAGTSTPKWVAAGYCAATPNTGTNRFLVLAYSGQNWELQNPGVHAVVYDLTSKTAVLEDSILLDDADNEQKIRVLSVGRYCVIVARRYLAGSGVPANFLVWIYDALATGSAKNTWNPYPMILGTSRGERGWTVGTDGTNVYLVEIPSGSSGTDSVGLVVDRDVRIHRFTIGTDGSSFTLFASRILAAGDGDDCDPGFSYAAGRIHVSYKRATSGHPGYVSVDTSLSSPSLVRGPIDVSTNVVGNTNYVKVVGTSADDAAVFWDGVYAPLGLATRFEWQWVKLGSTAPAARANHHQQAGLTPYCDPFLKGGRIYIGVTGNGAPQSDGAWPGAGSSGGNYGHVLMEVPSDAAAEDAATGNPFALMLPCALWSRDLSLEQSPQIPAIGVNDDAYFVTIREARTSDSIFRDSAASDARIPVPHTINVWSYEAFRVNFSDVKRWQHAELGDQTVLASALPYVYNGDRAHECGFIFRPSIVLVGESGVGSSWAGNDVVLFKVVYEWEDFAGRRWFSDTSYTYEYTVLANGSNIDLTIRPPWVTVKPDGANNFTGRINVCTYRAKKSAPDDWMLLARQQWLIWNNTPAFILDYFQISDTGANLNSTERAYIAGGELDNHIAPMCRSLIQHRDRLFAINLEDNSLYYTKPFQRGRGIEWSRYQTKPLPQRGMALGSIEGSLLVMTDKSILVLDGPGPSSTGIPPDAFARFQVLSQEQGCSEINAAWRTPKGYIFRSEQGLWLVTPQLGIVYIGAVVEDFVRQVDYFVDGSLDEELGRLRLVCKMLNTATDYDVSTTRILNYWYDSDRWSVDPLVTYFGSTTYSSVTHRGHYYLASNLSSVTRRTSGWYMDGVGLPSFATPYQMKYRSPWFRFDTASSFKRLWRVFAHVRLARQTVGPSLSLQHLLVTVETDGDPDRTTSFFFDSNIFAAGPGVGEISFDEALEMHVKFQKGRRYRVTLEERLGASSGGSVNPANGPAGYTFAGLGFELGMKGSGAKLGGDRAPTG